MISDHQDFFFLAIWWAGYFFPFFSHKLFITFVLHAIFFFRQALTPPPPPPPPPRQELNGRPLSKGLTVKAVRTLTHFVAFAEHMANNAILFVS